LLDRQSPHEQHPLIGGQLLPELGVVPIRVSIRREAPAGDEGILVASGIGHQLIISAVPSHHSSFIPIRAIRGATTRATNRPRAPRSRS
jgi:hypothetical protein